MCVRASPRVRTREKHADNADAQWCNRVVTTTDARTHARTCVAVATNKMRVFMHTGRLSQQPSNTAGWVENQPLLCFAGFSSVTDASGFAGFAGFENEGACECP